MAKWILDDKAQVGHERNWKTVLKICLSSTAFLTPSNGLLTTTSTMPRITRRQSKRFGMSFKKPTSENIATKVACFRHYQSAHSSVLEECAPSCPDPAQQVSQALKPLQEKINGKAPQQKLHDVEKDKRSLCALSASPHPIQRPIQIYKPRMQGKPLPLSQPPYSHLYL